MNGIKSRIAMLLLLAIVSLNVNAQYFEHDLRKNKWIVTDGFRADGLFDLYIIFTEDGKMNFKMMEKESDKVVSDFFYDIYLAPRSKEVEFFEESKVGKDMFGKFIVMNRVKKNAGGNNTKPTIAEIIDLSDDTMVLYIDRKNKLKLKAVK